jgi:hypothetical protein
LYVAYRRFLQDRFGAEVAEAALAPTHGGSTSHFQELVERGARLSGRTPERLLREFGVHAIATFHEIYPSYFPPEGARRFLMQLEHSLGRNVGKLVSEASPSHLAVQDLGNGRLRIDFTSESALCPLVAGLLDGTGAHYQTPVRHIEETCRRRGGDRCTFMVEVLQTTPPRMVRRSR